MTSSFQTSNTQKIHSAKLMLAHNVGWIQREMDLISVHRPSSCLAPVTLGGREFPVPSLCLTSPCAMEADVCWEVSYSPWHMDRTGGSLAVDLTYLEGSGWVDGHMCLLPHVPPVPTERPDLGVDGSLVPHAN